MTTAHRPTWTSKKGSTEIGGLRFVAPSAKFSSQDLPAHLQLKSRPAKVLRDKLQETLEEKELPRKRPRENEFVTENGVTHEETAELILERKSAAALEEVDDGGIDRNAEATVDRNQVKSGTGENESDSSDDEDSEDEEEELRLELERIKQERAAQMKMKNTDNDFAPRNRLQVDDSRLQRDPLLAANPLLNLGRGGEDSMSTDFSARGTEFRVKRRWNDDVVFRNQARSEKQIVGPRFVNDTVRNDFHRRFLDKYIR
mmetsp:Transcript_854/g.1602  ORF Transcript_854/g.1602 Transcript_854/m.1602 type:complete len:258 (-) Transcript_854:658-1431(-)